jgi:hypothetical protein
LANLIRPQIVVANPIPRVIFGTDYASDRWPEPHSTIENGELVVHCPPRRTASERDHFAVGASKRDGLDHEL